MEVIVKAKARNNYKLLISSIVTAIITVTAPLKASANAAAVLQSHRERQEVSDFKKMTGLPPKNDGFLVVRSSFKTGPETRFCYKAKYSVLNKSCIGRDVHKRKVHKPSFSAQELLDQTYGVDVTEFVGMGPYPHGVVLYYTILR